MKCSRCSCDLHEGDAAYEQVDRVIRVKGKAVTFEDETAIVCQTCAEDKELA